MCFQSIISGNLTYFFSLNQIRREQVNSSDPESSPMDFDFLVGGNFHSVQSYFSVANNNPTSGQTSDDDDVLYQ